MGGRIAALGRSHELIAAIGGNGRAVELRGATVLPGFVDPHLHLLEAASLEAKLDLRGLKRLRQVLSALEAYASQLPRGTWVRAFGLDEALLEERRGPTRAELDAAVPDKPLRLRHQTLHASWLNSCAIERLGLDDPSIPLPTGACVFRDHHGRATGLVVGLEKWISQRIPKVSADELEWRAKAFSKRLAEVGVTAIADAGAHNGLDEVRLFARLVKQGIIRQRVSLMLGADYVEQAPEAAKVAAESGLRLDWVKFMPTSDTQPQRWASVLRRVRALGLGAAFHVTELEEMEAVLTTIELARTEASIRQNGLASLRLEHASLVAPNYLRRIARSGAWIVANPGFLYYRGAKYRQEPGLLPYLFPLKTLSNEGIPIAAASDCPVIPSNPLVGIASACLRETQDGEPVSYDQRLSVREAYSLFTEQAAKVLGIEAGIIASGKLADLVVFSKDPTLLSPKELLKLKPEMTIIGGDLVYQRESRGKPSSVKEVNEPGKTWCVGHRDN